MKLLIKKVFIPLVILLSYIAQCYSIKIELVNMPKDVDIMEVEYKLILCKNITRTFVSTNNSIEIDDQEIPSTSLRMIALTIIFNHIGKTQHQQHDPLITHREIVSRLVFDGKNMVTDKIDKISIDMHNCMHSAKINGDGVSYVEKKHNPNMCTKILNLFYNSNHRCQNECYYTASIFETIQII